MFISNLRVDLNLVSHCLLYLHEKFMQTRPDSLCRSECPEIFNLSLKYTNTLLYGVLFHE